MSLLSTYGNTTASDLRGDQSFFSFVNVCCKSYIFTVVTLSRSKMESFSRTIKLNLNFFKVFYISPQHIHYSMKSSHIFQKLGCLVEIKFRDTNAPVSNTRTVQGSAFPPTQVPTFSLTCWMILTQKKCQTLCESLIHPFVATYKQKQICFV